ncbi:MAG: hybrid sensor histidine kinase/response regulator [Fibrobacteres bacterium]|nr:hybrid sensor histidine kinase/response regulator [Fibrobacterota bacterium]
MTDYARFKPSINVAGVILVFGSAGAVLLAAGHKDYPGLHTILDTGICLFSGLLALLFREMGARSDSPFSKWVSVSFATTSTLEFAHALVPVEWSGRLASITGLAEYIRPITWPPAAYMLPIGLGCSIWLLRKGRKRAPAFATAMFIVGAMLLISFYWLPRYSVSWLGVTRVTLILVPPLWLAVGIACWRMRAVDRVFPVLTQMAAVLFTAQMFMLHSRSVHDTMAMVAHVGKLAAYLILLLSLMAMASRDLRDRILAERDLARANDELERRVRDRTAQLESTHASLEAESAERRRTKEAFRESEDRFRLMADGAPVLIWSSGLDQSCTWFNKQWLAFVGRTMAMEVGAGWTENVHPEDLELRLIIHANAFEARQPFEMEYRIRRHDGEWRWLLDSGIPRFEAVNAFAGFIGSCIDVTESHQAKQKLQAQMERLDLLNHITRAIGEKQDLQSIFQVVVRSLEENLSLDFGCICEYDPVAENLTVKNVGMQSRALAMEPAFGLNEHIGIDSNGLSRCLHGQLVHEPDISAIPFPFQERLARGGLRSLIMAPLIAESTVFGVLVIARRAIGSFTGEDCDFLKQLSDHVGLAVHQAQLNAALQQAYDDLHQAQQAAVQHERLRAVGQMASGIAHDINNAISPVMLYTESLLEQEPNLSVRARKYLQTIQQAIEDVAHTVSRMREFYRQKEPLQMLAPVHLDKVIGQVVDLSRARWLDIPQQQGIVIRVKRDFEVGLPVILGVESEIREALINLVFNAVDAMPDGGTLTLRAGIAGNDSDRKEASGLRYVKIEVTDTGVGMDEDTRRRCLEPFFTTKGERGTGLGLAMVYGIAKRHGAEIEIESTAGEGTTVRMILPAASALSPGAAWTEVMTAFPTRLRILIVDDDPLLINSLRDILENDGHLVVAASGGQLGIDTFRAALGRKEPFAIVFTDLGMPYVDGRKVACGIKAASPSTPVVLLTGWGQRLVAEGDIPPHVDRVINKPPKLRDLRDALAHCCPPPVSGIAVETERMPL